MNLFFLVMCVCIYSDTCLVAQSCLTVASLPGSSVHGDSPGKDTGVGCSALFQEIFPTQDQTQIYIAGRFFTI